MQHSDRSHASLWNEVALEAIRLGDPVPTEITRALHIVHAAMYDAWAAYDEDAAGAYFTASAQGSDSLTARETAVSFAAYRALSEVFPDQIYLFTGLMETLGLDASDTSTSLETAAGVGNAAASTVIAARANDGSNAANDFEDTTGYEPTNSDDPNDPGFDPNAWTPLRVPNGTVRDDNGNPIATDNPASYTVQKPISPHWGEVDPFAIADSDSYLPPAPPKLGDFGEYVDAEGNVTTGDAAYREQFGELVEISANLTPEQKVIAEYWADGPQTSTPPGHWNEIAQDISVRDGHGLAEDVKMFFALNNALFDTGIAVWDAKYTYDYVRPQTAVRHLYEGDQIESWAGPNQGAQLIDGEAWIPYQDRTFVTPAFPEFTSGHSGFSYAGATVLTAFAGTDVYFDGSSRGAYDLNGDGESDLLGQYITSELAFEDYDGAPITLQWDTLFDAAAEAGLSRLYGGIHIQDGDLFGRQIGSDVGADVWERTALLFEQDADNIFDTSSMSVTEFAIGAGSDRILGNLADLNGLSISGFGTDDQIEINDFNTTDGRISVRQGSAIIDLDQDGDGENDATITLTGDFSEDRFIAVEANGVTSLRIAQNSDVELTDENERLFTEDDAANVVAAGEGELFLIGGNMERDHRLTDQDDRLLTSDPSDNRVLAGDGNDVVVDDDGNDTLAGQAGADLLIGGGGSDVLIGGKGNDVLRGGTGADVFVVRAQDFDGATVFVADTIEDFEPGVDTIEISGFDGITDASQLTFQTLPAGVAIDLGGSRFVLLSGITSPEDLGPNDIQIVNQGRNLELPDAEPVGLSDEADNFITDDDGMTTINANAGDDVVFSAGGGDEINGGDGSDVLLGGDGEDTLTGGQGNDVLTGGADGDLFRFSAEDFASDAPFVADTITDFQSGLDRIELSGFDAQSFDALQTQLVPAGLAIQVAPNRFIVLEGFQSIDELQERDFVFEDAPELELSIELVSDTGTDGDGVTSDPRVAGQVTGDAEIVGLFLIINGGTEIDVSAALNPDGSFTIDPTEFAELTDGTTAFDLRAVDFNGLSSEVVSVGLELDRSDPTISDLALNAASDTGELGDGKTDLREVTLTGNTEVGATVSAAGQETVADENGDFSISVIAIETGLNTIEFTATDLAGNSSTSSIEIEGTESGGPDVSSIGLANDSGGSQADLITNDPVLVGQLTDAGTEKLLISVNGGPQFDASVGLDGDAFELSQALLEQAAGGSLPDGEITVSVFAEYSAGQQGEGEDFTFVLDTTAPALTDVGLAASSDTGIRGDGITALRSVRLTGEGEPGASVSASGVSTVVSVDGTFTLNGVPVAEGENLISLTSVDLAGNSSQTDLAITGISAVEGQPVLVWNDITLEAIADNAEGATGASRILALQSVAVHDVVAAIDNAPAFLVQEDVSVDVDLSAAVAQASYVVLSYAYPAFQEELDAYLAEALEGVPDGAAEAAGVALGQAVADRLIQIRDADGWDDFETVSGSDVPGEWRETGPLYEPAIDPQWASLDTWAMQSADQFRVDAPPVLSSSDYAEAVEEVRAIGSTDSAVRTQDQTEAARFWKDGRGTENNPWPLEFDRDRPHEGRRDRVSRGRSRSRNAERVHFRRDDRSMGYKVHLHVVAARGRNSAS